MEANKEDLDIVIGIPCYNEAVTIGKVIDDFRRELPRAKIVVFNNNSSDKTVEIAKLKKVDVIHEKKQGKGNVVRNMFKTIDSDILIMVDGDDTYFAKDVHRLIKLFNDEGADMVVGNRLHKNKKGFSGTHRFGNWVFCVLLNYLFRADYKDILSGYRVMKRDFYQNIPLLGSGFEIETELTLQSLDRNYLVVETPINYKNRPDGSYSKISKFKDGSRIIMTIFSLMRDYRPMTFFSYLGLAFILLGMFSGSLVVREYYRTGFINRVPLAILTIALVIVGVNTIISGLILSAMSRRQKETEAIINGIKYHNRNRK